MKRHLLTLLAASAALAGCTGDSALPSPTGKGAIRAFNAIPGSPEVGFLIEERVLGGARYKSVVSGGEFDDFTYDFNFEVRFTGDTQSTRVATETVGIVADMDYTFVLSGDVTAPDVTVWENSRREFGETDTVFEVRFGHVAPTLGPVDVYLNMPGIAPVLGEKVGTVAFGEILDPLDFEAQEYVITATAVDDPSTVLFQSDELEFGARLQLVFTLLDADENDIAPHLVVGVSSTGAASLFQDARFPGVVRFLHSAIDGGPVDIFDDEMLMNTVVTDHAFGDVTDPIERPFESDYTYTPAGDPGVVLVEQSVLQSLGTRRYVVLLKSTEDELGTAVYTPDRQSLTTAARLQIFAGAFNHDFVDVFAVDPDDEPDLTAVLPRASVQYGSASQVVSLVPGSYDLYVTPFAERETIIAGPVRIDVTEGDVVETILYDVVDPELAELVIFDAP